MQHNLQQQNPGQLHIFFGAAPGVGKTWAMVDAGQEMRQDGHHVVVGFVDTHDRPEFASLLDGFENVPLREVEYQGLMLHEIDLNAILRRKPEIVLIDDLAHSNVPGTRNTKRYQDVVELLQAGISVYTTLNVQHVSSVAEAVEELTGIPVREQVPDFVLEMAASIRLIDLEPEELLRRLSKRSHGEMGDFFKTGNLLTLRELALRVAASRVDEELEIQADKNQKIDVWAKSSRILVGISASPRNERLLRATCQLVSELHTTWLAVHIETPIDAHLDSEARQRIQKHLHLAKELGAETLTVAGENVAKQLVNVAKQYSASRIVVGRSKRRWSPLRMRISLAEEIIDLSDRLDVIVLSGD